MNDISSFQRQEIKRMKKARRMSSLLLIDAKIFRENTRNAIRASTLIFVLRVYFVTDCSEHFRFYLH